ncbi:MAG TPA: hypothetical protein VGK67_08430 [Myxococcales bacterium]|jgi:DNA-binding transcriptional regulator YbjK
MSADKALTRLRKVMDQIASLAEPATSVDSFLVPSGIDAQKTAEFTAMMEKSLELLQGFQAQLEQKKKRSAAKLQRVAGKAAAPG